MFGTGPAFSMMSSCSTKRRGRAGAFYLRTDCSASFTPSDRTVYLRVKNSPIPPGKIFTISHSCSTNP